MSRPSRAAVFLVALLLAAILVVFVFAGASNKPRAGPSTADIATRCSSSRTANSLKRELFRRAALLHGLDQVVFDRVSSVAAIRFQQAQLSGYDTGTEASHCRASVVLDIPPGVGVSRSGPHNMADQIDYTVRRSADGTGDAATINNAEHMLAQLAVLAPRPSQAQDVPLVAPPKNAGATSVGTSQLSPRSAPQPWATPQHASRSQQITPPSRSQQMTLSSQSQPIKPPSRSPRITSPSRAVIDARRETTSSSPRRVERDRSKAVAGEPIFRSSPGPVEVARRQAVDGPSFDCRRATKEAHFAVCEDPYLASLDRRMANEFNQAYANGSPAVRDLLDRTRGRFLGYRNACHSSACIAATYRSRITEINDIAAGRWRVP